MKKLILLCVIGMFTLTACQNNTATSSVNETTTPSATITPHAASTQKPMATVTPNPVSDNAVPPKGTTIEENKTATDLIVTGGSTGVYLINNGRNYGIICPHCKCDIGAVGIYDLYYTISKHKAGETETIQGLKGCPAIRGCGQNIRYTVNVKYIN